jgi:phosphate transport system permease protein
VSSSAVDIAAGRRPRRDRVKERWNSADSIFKAVVATTASIIIVTVVGTVVFLLVQSWSAISHYGFFSFFGSDHWEPSHARDTVNRPNPYGILQFIYGTVVTSLIAMVIAIPMAIAVALFVTEMLPGRVRRPFSYLVDLLAAIPSVVYGFWGIFALIPALRPIGDAIANTLGKVPVIGSFFAGPFFGVSYLTAGVVLAIMVLPIITAICREVFATTPQEEKEAALALGATRWEMVRMAVLPRSRSGIFGAGILGLGRAIGETIAVTMVIGNSVVGITKSILGQGATMSSVIANEFTEATEPFHLSSLFVVAFWLLVFSLLVNVAGRMVVRRLGGVAAA